jgi:hypothetical protein
VIPFELSGGRSKGWILSVSITVMTIGLILPAVPARASRPINPPIQTGALAGPSVGWLSKVGACKYYVARSENGGSNTNPGTVTQPWESINKLVTTLQPSETGCVAAGTYTESHLAPTTSGSADKPIALKAQGQVIIAAPDDQVTFDFSKSSGTLSNWLIEGFTIDKREHGGVGVQMLGSSQGQIKEIALRNNVIRYGRAPAAVLIRGRTTDVLVEGNEIMGFQRYVGANQPASYHWKSGLGRTDANAISIEAIATADPQKPSIERLRIEHNNLHDNGGDGVQCQGGETVYPKMAFPFDPADIDIVDNRAVNTAGSEAVEENAYDIKSCQRVSIRGSDPPSPNKPAVQYNKIGELLPTAAARDDGGNNSDGTAIVLHYQARSILIENLRIWDVCAGLSIGRPEAPVRQVVIRRLLLFGIRYKEKLPYGSTEDANRCRSRGITITNAIGVDIYHTTVDGFVDRGIHAARGEHQTTPPSDIDIWNNVLVGRPDPTTAAPPRTQWWISLDGVDESKLGSDYNLFWHPDNNPATKHFIVGSTGLNLAQWRGRGFDPDRQPPLGSERGDPKFPAQPRQNDYYTASTSPARDGALANTGASVCGTGPDIGFLESCP